MSIILTIKLLVIFNRKVLVSPTLQEGKRITTRVVLSGCVLGVWDRVEKHLRGGEDGEGGTNTRMQVCRLRASEGQPSAIGILVPNQCVDDLTDELSADAESVESVYFTGDVEAKLPKIEKVEPAMNSDLPIKVEPQFIKIEVKSEAEIKTEPQIEPIIQLVKIEPKSESVCESQF